MLTPFGKVVRQFRIEKDMLLQDMAMAIDKSPAYVSAIEVGRKPIPDSYVTAVIRALGLNPVQARQLRVSADKTRKDVRVENLSEDQRVLMAAFARRLDEAPEDPNMAEIVERLRQALKSISGEQPFRRKRPGIVVPPSSAAALRGYAERVRSILVPDGEHSFPILDVLEQKLHLVFPDFHFDVVERELMGDDEGRVISGTMTLALREDVYIGAYQGNGRDRFTACHELAHFLLHRDVTFARARDESVKIFCDSEWQADTFAGALMMSTRHLDDFTTAAEAAAKCGMSGAAANHQFGIYVREGLKK